MRNFVSTPVYAREHKKTAILEVVKKGKFESILGNTLGVMAMNGRLQELPAMIRAFRDLVSNENSEIVAEVTSAKKLTAAQTKQLADVLKSKMGKDVVIQAEVDPEILGGLVINIGSMMIDNSLKGKLSKLRNSMKEVG